MKCLQRYLSVFVVCVLLSVIFSIGVSAQSVDVPKYKISQSIRVNYGSFNDSRIHNWVPHNGTQEMITTYWDYINVVSGQKLNVYTNIYIETIDLADLFLEPDGKAKVVYYSFVHGLYVYCAGGTSKQLDLFDADTMRALVTYNDGSMEYVDLVNEGNHNYSMTFTPKKSVTHIELIFVNTYIPNGTRFQCSANMGERSDSHWEMTIDNEPENTGLLKGLINLVNNIKEGVSNLKDGITNVFNSIVELPSKIWQFISDGLKSLFVPSEDFIVQFKNNIDSLLADKLGAVYQVIDITLESWDRIQANDQEDIIEIPNTTIDLPDNNKFSFGGYFVQIVPDGFGFLVNIIKTVVGIVCTVLFINGLRKKYDEVMGVEQ